MMGAQLCEHLKTAELHTLQGEVSGMWILRQLTKECILYESISIKYKRR